MVTIDNVKAIGSVLEEMRRTANVLEEREARKLFNRLLSSVRLYNAASVFSDTAGDLYRASLGYEGDEIPEKELQRVIGYSALVLQYHKAAIPKLVSDLGDALQMPVLVSGWEGDGDGEPF